MVEPLLAIVPVKDLTLAKSRLSSVLSANERRALVLGLLDRTLEILRSSRVIRASLVVTPDAEVMKLAASLGVESVRETRPGYNMALNEARLAARRRFPAYAPLVLAPDLPWLSGDDIVALAERVVSPRVLVIAPDAAGDGTNALAGWPVESLRFAFGANSCHEHATQATINGWLVEMYRSPGTGRDVDTPADLANFAADQSIRGLDKGQRLIDSKGKAPA
jgi:2-phospho-L-lactate/phosphoenolpyruvate guanylyltransferase